MVTGRLFCIEVNVGLKIKNQSNWQALLPNKPNADQIPAPTI